VNVLVLGAAVSGRAAAALARRTGHHVAVYDAEAAAVAPLRDERYTVHSGAWDAGHLRRVDLVVTSPGIAEGAPPVADSLAAGVPLISELEFASRHLGCRYLAVTGTNGKTTVTTAAADMLAASGIRAVAAGNVGTALSDVAGQRWDVVVVEASSFQLRFIDAFHPAAAAVLNVAPDHLDWHGSFEAYLAAKASIHRNQGPGDLLVFDADDAGAAAAVAGARARTVPLSAFALPGGGWGRDGDRVLVAGAEFPLPAVDPAFLLDLVAAASLALHAGAAPEAVGSVMAGFAPGPHRRTAVGAWGGVAWVDDSKATNPHAALAAVRAYPSVVLIAGGRNKGLDLSPLVAAPTVRRVIAVGEAAPELVAADPSGKVEVAFDMEQAVAKADDAARWGDTVLLAPGCASFDQFSSYRDRGERFTELVLARKEGATRTDGEARP
jgi:UDP-N-acetylmuramoylalanine--D-glutamate ligase